MFGSGAVRLACPTVTESIPHVGTEEISSKENFFNAVSTSLLAAGVKAVYGNTGDDVISNGEVSDVIVEGLVTT